MTTTDRKAYQRIYARTRRQEARQGRLPGAPRTVIAKASGAPGAGYGASICLTKAGLIPGRSYTAEPQKGGAILLTPVPEPAQGDPR